jgi:hypothetical protein
MPLVSTRGAASAQGFGEFAQATAANFIEDVFSTYLYTGNGTSQTITNGIDLSTKGGLVWTKIRSSASFGHSLIDTVRGLSSNLATESADGAYTSSTRITSFNTTGYALGANSYQNENASTFVSWTFRKQPKFFDVVTYTGTGSNTTIAHSLGSVPGSIIVKRTDTTAAWAVYHRSLANTQYLVLNTTAAAATGATWWNSTTPTSSVFSLGTDATVNASGGTYVAYLFAHDAGGFGLTGTDNVVSCGSFTTDGSGNASVNLGYEPQFWLYKPTIAARYWTIYDVMRGWSQTQIANLNPNVSNAEGGGAATLFYPTATGFDCVGSALDPSTQHIYIAIRRGPMKVPTLGTSVFNSIARTGTGATAVITDPNFVVDSAWIQQRTSGWQAAKIFDRLRGATDLVYSNTTSAEVSDATTLTSFSSNVGFTLGDDSNNYSVNRSGEPYINWAFRRAPGFFDEVCYTGDGGYVSRNHNLAAVPEMMIVKARSTTSNWSVYHSALGFGNYVRLNTTAASAGTGDFWYQTPTSTQFSTGGYTEINDTGVTYVAYLFATLAGVSKVGSYTGNGSTQTINCGFTGGARFVLIKRTDGTGGWYVYDTARGMTVLTDPYLLMNTTAAEVATLGSVTTVATGFALNSAILAAINVNAGTYIFLAIA